jgi:hypothetical protein
MIQPTKETAMKKTLLALAVLALTGSAFATGSNIGLSGSASAGVRSTSLAGAASTGNGTAYTATRGGQFASSTQSATNGLTFGQGMAGGYANVSGSTAAEGYAESYTKTTGTGIAGSLSFGESCAESEGRAAFVNPLTRANGVAAGFASSTNSNFAGTGAVGNGEAYRGNYSGTLSGYSATAEADGKVRNFGFSTPRENLSAETTAEAYSNSYKGLIAPSVTLGTAVGIQGNVNFGAAGALSNAQVGNLCSGCGPVVQPPVVVDERGPRGNNGWGNGDQGAPGNSGPNNNAENGPRGNRN